MSHDFGFFLSQQHWHGDHLYAPTCLEIVIILKYLQHFVGATLRGRPRILQNENS